MLRDTLSELHQASQVDVITKVLPSHNFLSFHINKTGAHWRSRYRNVQGNWRQSQRHRSCLVSLLAVVTVNILLPDRLGRVVQQ
jgi:hypothetical protein